MIYIFLIENYPWVLWCDMTGDLTKIGRRIGEWTWVGREERELMPHRGSALGFMDVDN